MMCKPITPFCVLVFTMTWITGSFTQNCPQVQSCPTSIITICDESANDQVFWNAPSFTWHPGLQSADLPESAADLNLTVLDTCPGVLTIKYTLFLDLDGDNLAESAVPGNNQFPGGKMLFGNAFTPGYAGTDTMVFDNRVVPDSMKFRFVLQTERVGGIVYARLRWAFGASAVSYLSARLPEGRHHILWTVEKNGVAKQFCEYVFRVKDCLPPLLDCLSGWSTAMPPSDTLTLHVNDFVQFAVDNITPNALLQFSMRVAGTGMGFPVDFNGHPITQLSYTCANLGFQNVEIWVRDIAGNTTSCEAGVTLFDFEGNCVAVVEPFVCATTVFVNSDTIRQVTYDLETLSEPGLPPIELSVTPLPNGCVELPDFSQYPIVEVAVKPRKNDHQLNGVSTFDLVLINRHIIGLQLFNKTWKYIAADANNSGTLTTFDIIELRKLILGIYDSLPNCTAWKFVIADCSLDSLNPFNSSCPGSLVFNPAYMPESMNFLGIKSGDVNGNADPDSLTAPPEDREPATLLIPDHLFAAGEIIEVPIYLERPAEWIACQWAMQWDPEALHFENLLPGALPGVDENAVGQPQPGVLTFNWFDTESHWLLPGQPLCTLRLRALKPGPLRNLLQWRPAALRPEAYTVNGINIPLRIVFADAPSAVAENVVFAPQPNPTTGAAAFPFQCPAAETAILELYDDRGCLVFRTARTHEAGNGALELPADSGIPAGVYAWRIQVGQTTKTGRLVRL